MKLPQPLYAGRLIKRYNRFLADVTLDDGETLTAHCPNPGSMMGLKEPGSRVWLSKSDNPKRKLSHTLELVEADGALVGIHTGRPNDLAAEAIAAGRIKELPRGPFRREVKYGENSRIDILIEPEGEPPLFVEIKNVHLMRDAGLAEFPDCVTTRGAKHLRELSQMIPSGARAVMLYIVQRPDCDEFALAADLDPGYAEAFSAARAAGVEAFCYACDISLEAITVARPLPLLEAAAKAPGRTGS